MLLISTQNVTSDTSQKDYDTGAFPFKAWLRDRIRQAERDTIEQLAKSMVADSRLPAQGSKALYTAHLRAKRYDAEDIATFELAWQEMRDQDTSE